MSHTLNGEGVHFEHDAGLVGVISSLVGVDALAYADTLPGKVVAVVAGVVAVGGFVKELTSQPN